MRWFSKSCPRCRGDVYTAETLEEAKFLTCLQCGREFSRAAMASLRLPVPQPQLPRLAPVPITIR